MKRCFCGRCSLDVEDADLVVNGTPMCDVDCLRRAREEQSRIRHLARARIGGQYVTVQHARSI